MNDVAEIMKAIDLVRFNPSAIIQIALGILEDVNNGDRVVVDPTNPFVFLLEASAVNAAAAMAANEALTRKQYGSMALTEDELYMHMSDKDYLGRFANPSRTIMTLLLNVDEVLERALDTGLNGSRKIVIPRHTSFTVADHTFTMQYPIELRVGSHGGIQVLYDVTRKSPLMSIESNVVDYDVINIDGVKYLRLNIPVLQLDMEVYYPKLTSAALFDSKYTFTGSFHYARVYRALTDGSWSELATTHTDQVFNPSIPTAVLTVYDGQLRVRIPTVYQVSGAVDTELRIEVYTTVGELNLILNNYAPEAYGIKWLDYDNDDNGYYMAPLGQFNSFSVYSDSTVSGGTVALTFDELRERVITNSLGDQQLPITNAQVGSKLENLGYNSVVNVDLLTNRQFLATRTLPRPDDGSVSTGIASTIGTVQSSMALLKTHSDIFDNGDRLTITPKTLFQSVNGVIEVINPSVVANLKGLYGQDGFVGTISGKNYLYTPFYYVWEILDDHFDCRPYHLDSPEIVSKAFVQENASVGLVISTASQSIEKTDTGYRIMVKTSSGDVIKTLSPETIHAQLSVPAIGENGLAYLNGVLLGQDPDTLELIYGFDLVTRHDINSSNGLVINNFTIYGSVQDCTISLQPKFNLTYGVSGYISADMETSAIDELVEGDLLPESHIGIIHEQFNTILGYTLDALWVNNRSVVSSITYQEYATDVLAYYDADVYQNDPLTGAPIIVNNNGTPTFTLLHAKGDPILHNGDPTYAHLKGELVRDGSGELIATNPRGMLRQIDMFLIDGLYYFANAATSVAYAQSIPDTVADWLIDDIEPISDSLLEQSTLSFYPQRTTGTAQALVMEGAVVTLSVEQRFTVNFYMTESGYKNSSLRLSLTSGAISVIAEALKKSIVRVIDIENKILNTSGDDVITVSVSGLGGDDLNYDIVSLQDDSARLGVQKKLVSLADGTYAVEDDVVINFLQHR